MNSVMLPPETFGFLALHSLSSSSLPPFLPFPHLLFSTLFLILVYFLSILLPHLSLPLCLPT